MDIPQQVSSSDRAILRELPERQAQIARLPCQQETEELCQESERGGGRQAAGMDQRRSLAGNG